MPLSFFANLYAKKFSKFDAKHILANLTELDQKYGILGIDDKKVIVRSKEIFDKYKVSYGHFAMEIDFANPTRVICRGGRFWKKSQCRPHYHIYYAAHRDPNETTVCVGGCSESLRNAIEQSFDLVAHMNIIDDMLQNSDHVLNGLYNKCKVCDDVIPGPNKRVCDECKD